MEYLQYAKIILIRTDKISLPIYVRMVLQLGCTIFMACRYDKQITKMFTAVKQYDSNIAYLLRNSKSM